MNYGIIFISLWYRYGMVLPFMVSKWFHYGIWYHYCINMISFTSLVVSLWDHRGFTKASWYLFGIIMVPLWNQCGIIWYQSGIIKYHYGIISVVIWYQYCIIMVSLCHKGIILVSLWHYYSVMWGCHCGIIILYIIVSSWYG